MNFDWSDDQKALKGEARRFLDERCPTTRVRKVLDDAATLYDADLWKQVAELGWVGAAIPEEHGGTGLGHIELCALAEELGRSVAPIPFSSTVYLFAEAIMLAGSEAQKTAILPKIAAGDLIGAVASSEGPGGLTPGGLRCKVEGGRLTGEKLPVTDGSIAHHAIVLAQDGQRPSLFLVDLTGEGVSRETLKTLDPTRDAAKLTFASAPAERLGEQGQGLDLLQRIFDRAAVPMAFEQVGGAERCLEMAKDYAMQRYAFGRVIASYQAIKHKLADIYVKTELARSNAYYGAWALASGAAELPTAAAAARLSATEAYDFAAKENLQTHGGMGFTWDADCHLHYRRSRQLGLMVGGPPVWRERLIGELEKRNAA